MKIKIISIILTFSILFLFTACSKHKKSTDGTSSIAIETSSNISQNVTEGGKETNEIDTDSSDKNAPSAASSNDSENKSSSTTGASSEAKDTSNSPDKSEDVKNPEVSGDSNNGNNSNKENNENDNSNEEVPSPEDVTYEEYHAMSASEQQAFFNSFESVEAFVEWYNKAKTDYEKENPDKEIGDGPIDIGGIIG